MAKSVNEMSVVALEKALSTKKARLDKLLAQRIQLQKQLDGVERKIRDVGGDGAVEETKRSRRVRKLRPRNKQPLAAYVREILGRTKKGLTIDEVHAKVLDSGYKTKSENFKNVIYQCLYHAEDITQDADTGRYQLKT